MPRPLAKVGVLFLIALVAISASSLLAHASIPVMNGKMLVYMVSDDKGSSYFTALYMYNDTTVIIPESINSLEKGVLIVSYDPASNTLRIHGPHDIDYYGLDVCNTEYSEDQGLLLPFLFVAPHLLLANPTSPILPKSLLDNLDSIISAGHVNYVIEYYNTDSKLVRDSCTIPVNTTIFSVNKGNYMGEPTIIATLSRSSPEDNVTAKAYWRTDGVLLLEEYSEHSSSGFTAQGSIKLIAEDDLGLKKAVQPVQPPSTSTTTTTSTSKPPVTSTKTTTSQRPSTTATTAGPGTSSTTLKQQTQPSPARAKTQWNTAVVAGVVAVVAIAIAIIMLRRHQPRMIL